MKAREEKSIFAPNLVINNKILEPCNHANHANCFIHQIFPPGLPPLHLQIINNSNSNHIQLLNDALQEYMQTPPEELDEIDFDVIPRSSNTSSIIFWKNGVRCFPNPTQRELHLDIPFAPVTKPLFNWAALDAWNTIIPLHKDLAKMKAWLTKSSSLARMLGKKENHLQQEFPNVTRSIPTSDLQHLVDQKTLIKLPANAGNVLSAAIFKIPKAGGKEARMVWDGRMFDKLLVSRSPEQTRG